MDRQIYFGGLPTLSLCVGNTGNVPWSNWKLNNEWLRSVYIELIALIY